MSETIQISDSSAPSRGGLMYWLLLSLMDVAVIAMTIIAVGRVLMNPHESDVERSVVFDWSALVAPGLFFWGPVAFSVLSLFRDIRLLGGLKVLFGIPLLAFGMVAIVFQLECGLLMVWTGVVTILVGSLTTPQQRHRP